MTARYDIDTLKTRLDGIKTEEHPALVKQKSRDFYWYSPTLKRQLDDVTADIIVSPKSEAEVLQVLAAAHELGIPVTPRGTGTGNYGQAMPLSGGILLDLAGFSQVKEIGHGRVVAEPGAIIAKIDK
ncbi:MAG TPA: FAD-binding protein, partial [Saliniramus sp.]|nr:FAD-binding protein [Saliniramus sp.]